MQATGRVLTEYEGFDSVVGSDEVWATWYQLVDNMRPIAFLSPHRVPARRLAADEDGKKIWPARKKVPNHPPKPRRTGSDQPALDDDPMASGGEDDPDDMAEPDHPMAESEGDLVSELEAALFAMESFEGFGAEGTQVEEQQEAATEPAPAPATAEPASSSSAEVPPPPPPSGAVAAAAPANQGALRRGAAVTIHCYGGSISFYRSKGAFEAVCLNPDHGRCVVTRTAKSKGLDSDGRRVGGRPVGFLAAWLAAGETTGSKAEHWGQLHQPLERRVELRRLVGETPDGRFLLSFEREPEAGEPAEPRTLSGYV